MKKTILNGKESESATVMTCFCANLKILLSGATLQYAQNTWVAFS